MRLFKESGRIRQFLHSGVVDRRHIVVMLASLSMAACAGIGGLTADSSNDEKVAVVSVRAEARWKALINNDISAAYAFLSPATRETVSLERYRGSIGGELRYTAAKVDKVACDAEVCKVRLMVTYDHRLMKGIITPIEESWVLDKGQFWFLYRG